jgi:hypothetical protein
MKEIGEHIQGHNMLDIPLDGGIIIHVSQVAHVTFYITEIDWGVDENLEPDKRYKLFEESAKRGLREWTGEDHLTDIFDTYEEATYYLAQAQANLENILEYKRKGKPTQKQVYFLFSNEIPIPIDLTWGQASDLIDEKLDQKAKEREVYFEEKTKKYQGFQVGMRIDCVFYHPSRIESGEITRLTSGNRGQRYAYVKYDHDNHVDRWDVETLKMIVERSLNDA